MKILQIVLFGFVISTITAAPGIPITRGGGSRRAGFGESWHSSSSRGGQNLESLKIISADHVVPNFNVQHPRDIQTSNFPNFGVSNTNHDYLKREISCMNNFLERLRTHKNDNNFSQSRGSNTIFKDLGSSPVAEQHSKGTQTDHGDYDLPKSQDNEKIQPKIDNTSGKPHRMDVNNEEPIGNSGLSASSGSIWYLNSNSNPRLYGRNSSSTTTEQTGIVILRK